MPASPPASAPHDNAPRFPKYAPFSSTSIIVTEQARTPQQRGTDDTASAQTMGEVVAEMSSMRGSHMPAELPRQTAPNHRFATQAARTQRAAPLIFKTSQDSAEPHFWLSMRAQGRL